MLAGFDLERGRVKRRSEPSLNSGEVNTRRAVVSLTSESEDEDDRSEYG